MSSDVDAHSHQASGLIDQASVPIDEAAGLVDIGSTTLYHEVTGRGPAVLFITGGTGDAR